MSGWSDLRSFQGGITTHALRQEPAVTPMPVFVGAEALMRAGLVHAAPGITREAAAEKVRVILEQLGTEQEQALLFHTLRHALDWRSERAETVLKKAGWWLS